MNTCMYYKDRKCVHPKYKKHWNVTELICTNASKDGNVCYYYKNNELDDDYQHSIWGDE